MDQPFGDRLPGGQQDGGKLISKFVNEIMLINHTFRNKYCLQNANAICSTKFYFVSETAVVLEHLLTVFRKFDPPLKLK